MASKGGGDLFANLAVISCAESAANTLTFKKLETGVSLFEKIAWILHRIEYYMDLTATIFNTNEDTLDVALCASDQISSLIATNNGVLDTMRVARIDIGTAATAHFVQRPFARSFADLPSGGIIVPPNPLYLGVKGTGLASAQTVVARVYYTTKVLQPEEFWELVEARRMISA